MKHTKPPWEIDINSEPGYIFIISVGGGPLIGFFPASKQNIANMTLMSAAPELLAACRTALRNLPPEEFPENDREWRAVVKIRKAIEKAIGKGQSKQ